MPSIPDSIIKKLNQRKQDASFRTLTPPSTLIDFSSNDYLGFSRSSSLYEQTNEYLSKHNIKLNGSTGSRLLSGNHTLFEQVENLLTQFHQTESALIFNSGYDANLGLLSSVPQRGDLIFYDEYIHASIRDGIRLSNAKAYKYKHNNLADLDKNIEKLKTPDSNIYIITKSIFSMDGDTPDLRKVIEISQKYKSYLIVDEAHATGVIGKKGVGLVQELNLQEQVFARVQTFGKGIGCHGAAILGSSKLKDYLINFSRPFIYSTALPPHTLANILLAYQRLETNKDIQKLNQNIQYFKTQVIQNQLEHLFISSNSSIHCCIIEGNKKVKQISKKLNLAGYNVKAILHPTVPKNQERLRFCLHSFNTFAEIEAVLFSLRKILE